MDSTPPLPPEATALLARLAAFYHLEEVAVVTLALHRLAWEAFDAPAKAMARSMQAQPPLAPPDAPQ